MWKRNAQIGVLPNKWKVFCKFPNFFEVQNASCVEWNPHCGFESLETQANLSIVNECPGRLSGD